MNEVDNSFYHQNLSGVTVLVLVPHQDDEINVAGNAIYNFAKQGARVLVCFSTNGDYFVSAKVRIKEAIKALNLLGCSKENIYFLGYGDTPNNSKTGHIFYSHDKIVTSQAGYNQTYADLGYYDYSYKKTQLHSKYNNSSFCKDLKSLILDICPDIIISVDLDTHSDHRMLSLSLDKVIGEILKEYADFKPIVLKRFAYCLAYFSKNDFYNINLIENTYFNEQENKFCVVNKSYYVWDNRIRLPIIEGEYGRFIFNKTIFRALLCHKSQSAVLKAVNIINSDEVFFERRTDSLSYKASITVSSGTGQYLNDFRILNLNDVDSYFMDYKNYLWMPDLQDKDKIAIFRWNNFQSINHIRIYGNVEDCGRIRSLQITFDNGFHIETDTLPKFGKPLDIFFMTQKNVLSCSMKITQYEGSRFGISECEFYCDERKPIFSFIKILIGDNFAYNYIVSKKEQNILLDIYKYNVKENIKLSVVSGDAIIVNNMLILKKNNRVVVRAECINSRIFDQIIIERKSGLEIKFIKFLQKIENNIYIFISRILRKYEFFKNNSIIETIKSIKRK